MDMQNTGNKMETPADEAETISICPIESKPPNPLTKHPDETDGSSHHPGILNMCTHMITPADEVGNIRMCQIDPQMPNSPAGSTTSHSDEPNSCRNHMDMLGTHTDGHSIKTHALTPRNKPQTVKMCPNNLKMWNSPNMAENVMPRHSYQWRKVSIDGADVSTLLNMLTNTPSWNFAFEQFEGRDKLIAVNVEGKRVGNRVGNCDKQSSDMDGTTSGGSADSKQVKAMLLAANSQHTCYRLRAQGNSSPVSSESPTNPTECPYGHIRCQHQCRRLQVEPLKVSQVQKVKTTYLQCARVAQPHGDAPKCQYGVHRPIHWHNWVKIASINVSGVQEHETAHLECASTVQPLKTPS